MKNISTYIIEKLVIDKDVKKEKDISKRVINKNDKFFAISAECMELKNEIKIYHPMVATKITKKYIIYNTHDGKTFAPNYILNSNHLYEVRRNDHHVAIFMPISDGIEFLELILERDLTKKDLYDYYDKEDEWIDDYPLQIDYTEDEAKEILAELKDEANK